MSSPSNKRLQVFVSSTYRDLRKERQAAVEAILQAGHIPAGMELFAAGDKSQMEVIKRWIDESDVFLLILGGRYGSVEEESGKSYTHLEYEYAVETGKPLFACMIREEVAIKRGEQEGGSKLIERENPKALAEFRTVVGSNLVKMWSDEKDIQLGILNSLSEIERDENLSGWVRSEESFNTAEMANEVTRLSKENARLREQGVDVEYCGLSYGNLHSLLSSRNLLKALLAVGEMLRWNPRMEPDRIANQLTVEEGDEYQGADDGYSAKLAKLNSLIQMGLLILVSDGIRPPRGKVGSGFAAALAATIRDDEATLIERIEITGDGKRFLNRLLMETEKESD